MPRWPARSALLAALLLSAAPALSAPADPPRDAAGDPLPDGALARVGTTRLRHCAPAHRVAFSPDGKSLASGASGGPVCLWETATGKLIRHFDSDKGLVNGLAFSPDGKTLLISAGGTTCLCDVATGKKRLTLRGDCAAFAPDGKTVVNLARPAGVIDVWDAAEGRPLHRWEKPIDCPPREPVFSADGKRLATVGVAGESVVLFDPATGEDSRAFGPLKREYLSSLDLSADGKRLATGSQDGSVSVWDARGGIRLHQIAADDVTVTSVRFRPDGKVFAAGDEDGRVRLWDAATGNELRRWVGHVGEVGAVAFSPDGKVLATAGEDQTVRLWEAATGKELPQSAGPGPISCAALSGDGRLLVTGYEASGLRLWGPATGKPLARAGLDFDGPASALALSADGKLIAAGNRAGNFAVWEAATGKKRFETKWGQEAAAAGVLAFSPDGRELAVVRHGRVGAEESVRCHDTATGKYLRSLPVNDGDTGTSSTIHFPPYALIFAPDGQTFLMASDPDGVSVREAATGKELRRLNSGRERAFSGLAVSPDGRTVATSRKWGGVRLWETATGALRGRLGPALESWEAVAIAPDGRLLAAAGAEENMIRVWQLPAGRELRTFRWQGGRVTHLAFAAGKLLSVGADGTALVWDTSGMRAESKGPPGKIGAEAAWATLADADAARAFETIARLSESPAASIALLRERLKPVPLADGKRIARLVAQLDDDEFDKREQASRELEKLGTLAGGALRKAVEAARSAEVVRRAGDLLKKIEGEVPSGERLREVRALEALEALGTPEAKNLLEEMAGGAPDAALTREAKAALGRLAKRAGP